MKAQDTAETHWPITAYVELKKMQILRIFPKRRIARAIITVKRAVVQ